MQPSCDMAMMRTYAAAGWRNVMLDLEHSPFSEADVVAASMALAGVGAAPFLKMPNDDADLCARYLHFGIRNFVLPHVEDAASIEATLARLLEVYWVDPAGIRLFPLIESQRGLAHLRAICALDRVAAVMIGAGDLGRDLGFSFRTMAEFDKVGRELTPRLLDALDEIRACGKLNGCGLMRSWFEFFPLERLDFLTLQLADVSAASALAIAPVKKDR